jgi:hypothetical protein
MLARDVWKEGARHTPLDNVIDVHIARLRKKIDDAFEHPSPPHGPPCRFCAEAGGQMIRFQNRNVRTRLTLWYLAVPGGILMLFAGGTSAFLFLHLRETLDEAVADDVESVEAQLSFRPDGTSSVGPNGAKQQDPDAQQDRYLEIRSPDGSLLYRNNRLGDRVLGGSPSPGEGKGGYSQHSIHWQNGPRLRVASRLALTRS